MTAVNSDVFLDQNSIIATLERTLNSCSECIQSGDFHQTQISISELSDFIDSILRVSHSSSCEDPRFNARDVLFEIHRYISSPSLDQAVIDALSFELPKSIAKFACFDHQCMEIVDSVIQQFIERCSPRDMLSILCEALDSPKNFYSQSYFDPILRGLSEVFVSLQRRHFEQIKVAIPVILNCFKTVASESDDKEINIEEWFASAIGIACSIQTVCLKLDGRLNEKLRALLGLYVLQILALVSIFVIDEASCLPLVLQLSQFTPYCGLSYIGFIAGSHIDTLIKVVCGENEDDNMCCFPYVKHGAALAVVWGHISSEVSQASEENLNIVKDEIRSSHVKRWEAIGMLKNILSFVNISWELKKHSVNFLLEIMDGHNSQYDNNIDSSAYMPSLFAGLQAVEMIIIYAPDVALKKDAFIALKRVVADIPMSLRFDILKALIINCDISSMVLSGLNLFRFMLITESVGKTKYSGVLSEEKLQKVYNEWLLPLRTLVTGIMAQNPNDYDQLGVNIVCALNPVELVLFRCIELTEERLKDYA